MTNEERCRSWLRSQFSSTLASFFSLISSSFLWFLSISLNAGPWNPLLSLSHAYLAKDGIRGHDSSPRQVVASTWSNPARPSELVTSPLSYLGAQVSQRLARASQGSEKGLKWPICPPFWVFSIFFSKWSFPDEIRVWHIPIFIPYLFSTRIIL